MEKPILKISNLNKVYGDGCDHCRDNSNNLIGNYCPKCKSVYACRNINFEVYEGEILGVVGESGSGKSTLLKVINGLEDIQAGEILINGEVYNCENCVGLSGKKRAEVGMVFQQYNLYRIILRHQ